MFLLDYNHFQTLHSYKRDVTGSYTVMSDSEDSTVTYTAVSSPFEDGSNIGSPGVDGPPIMPEDPYAYIMAAYQVPPSPDYIPGPEEPQSPPPLDFVPEPMYPEYMPKEDEILPAEEQPLPAAASPTIDSLRYVPEDDDDDEEEEPFGDDANDEDEDEDEEEHPASADSIPPVHRMTARISIRDEPSISLPPREEVERLLALTTPPPSPLTPLSSPLPQIPSPTLPTSSPASVLPASPPASPIRPLGYRVAMIRLRAKTLSTYHPLPLPTSSLPLQLLSSDHRTDRPEITLLPRKRFGVDLGPRAEEVGYGIRYVWVDPRETVEEVALMTLEGVNTRVTKLTAVQEQDTQDIYAMIGILRTGRPRYIRVLRHWVTKLTAVQEQDTQDIYAVIRDTQDRQTQIYQSVETLVDDKVSYMTRSEILALRSVVMGRQAVISQLQAADRKSQVVTLEMLQAEAGPVG
ncbi:hypothetical protein Tco_1486686 [Tanacetum coccineum]